ncbi:MAG: hypothetical protein ABFS02_05795, partial [Pseudomonadota bacterium]
CDRPAPSVASGFRQSLPERRFGWLLKILSNQVMRYALPRPTLLQMSILAGTQMASLKAFGLTVPRISIAKKPKLRRLKAK